MKDHEYNFESLIKESKTEGASKVQKGKTKLSLAGSIYWMVGILSIFLGYRWHMSLGGKLLIISGILILILNLSTAKNKVPKVVSISVVLFLSVSLLIGIFEYQKGAYPDIKFSHSKFQLGTGGLINVYVKSKDSIDPKAMMVTSSNDRVASYDLENFLLSCHDEGNSIIEVKDRFGNKTEMDVGCVIDDRGFVDLSVPSFVEVGSVSPVFMTSSNTTVDDSKLKYEVFDNQIIEVVDNTILALNIGKTWVKPMSFQADNEPSEILVIEKGMFVVGDFEARSRLGVGDKVPLTYFLNEELRDKDLDISNDYVKYSNGNIEFLKETSVSFEVAYEDENSSYEQMLTFHVFKDSLNAVYLPQVKDTTLRISNETKLDIQAIPSYSSIKNVDVVVVDETIVEYSDGVLIPKSSGETEVVVYVNRYANRFTVIVE